MKYLYTMHSLNKDEYYFEYSMYLQNYTFPVFPVLFPSFIWIHFKTLLATQ